MYWNWHTDRVHGSSSDYNRTYSGGTGGNGVEIYSTLNKAINITGDKDISIRVSTASRDNGDGINGEHQTYIYINRKNVTTENGIKDIPYFFTGCTSGEDGANSTTGTHVQTNTFETELPQPSIYIPGRYRTNTMHTQNVDNNARAGKGDYGIFTTNGYQGINHYAEWYKPFDFNATAHEAMNSTYYYSYRENDDNIVHLRVHRNFNHRDHTFTGGSNGSDGQNGHMINQKNQLYTGLQSNPSGWDTQLVDICGNYVNVISENSINNSLGHKVVGGRDYYETIFNNNSLTGCVKLYYIYNPDITEEDGYEEIIFIGQPEPESEPEPEPEADTAKVHSLKITGISGSHTDTNGNTYNWFPISQIEVFAILPNGNPSNVIHSFIGVSDIGDSTLIRKNLVGRNIDPQNTSDTRTSYQLNLNGVTYLEYKLSDDTSVGNDTLIYYSNGTRNNYEFEYPDKFICVNIKSRSDEYNLSMNDVKIKLELFNFNGERLIDTTGDFSDDLGGQYLSFISIINGNFQHITLSNNIHYFRYIENDSTALMNTFIGPEPEPEPEPEQEPPAFIGWAAANETPFV